MNNTWGDSSVSTKYMYHRIHAILDLKKNKDVHYHLSRLMDELAHNFKADTGNFIGEE